MKHFPPAGNAWPRLGTASTPVITFADSVTCVGAARTNCICGSMFDLDLSLLTAGEAATLTSLIFRF
jgi:hypothetical protein